MSWKKVKLGDLLFYEQPTKYIVESDQYNDEYPTPVLTAGKSFILGYTNEASGIYTNLPAIIFDDFTTECKYVDFQFKVKSSAMKILTVNKASADVRFMFYLLSTLNVDHALHKRYWISKFAPYEVLVPPLPAQQRIAEILDNADALRKKDKQLLQYYDDLSQSLFIELFGDPVRNGKGWEVRELGNVCTKITDGEHGTVKRLDSGKLYLMARNIRDNEIDLSDVSYISNEDNEKIIKRCNPEKGDLLLVCVGATIGRACIVPETLESFSLARSVALIKPNRAYLNPFYLYSFAKSSYMQSQIKQAGNSSAQAGLYTGKIKAMNIYVPPVSLQNQFAQQIQNIEQQKEKVKAQMQQSENLFQALLQQAFNGGLN